jgi:transglutaminase-like putative cysteine protease
MVYRVTHLTSYKYSQAVSICHNEARLTPRTTSHQRLLRSQLLVEPAVATHDRGVDYFGNGVHWFALQEAHTHLDVTAVSEIDISPFQSPALALSGAWEPTRDRLREDRSTETLGAYEFVFESPHVRVDPDLAAYAQVSFTRGRPLLEAVLDLTRRIHAEFQYQPGSTTVATPVREVLRAKRGVCQDFAHVELGMLRSLGLAARYVSGYIYNRRDEGEGEPGLTGADASHAWISVYCPDFGYVDFDPTNGVIPSDEHVTLAWGRDFSDASPLKGVILGGGEHTVSVSVDVERV